MSGVKRKGMHFLPAARAVLDEQDGGATAMNRTMRSHRSFKFDGCNLGFARIAVGDREVRDYG